MLSRYASFSHFAIKLFFAVPLKNCHSSRLHGGSQAPLSPPPVFGLWLWVRGCCRKSLYCLATISWQVCHVGMVPTPDAKRSPAGPQNGRKQCAQPRTFAETARRYNTKAAADAGLLKYIRAEIEARPLYPQGLGLPRIISPFAASSGGTPSE
jgi:hypothetical protein